MRSDVLIGIMFHLLFNEKANAEYFAKKYDISTRTVYRYIEELDMAKIPIQVIPGRGGGFKILDTFKLSTNFFTKDEYTAVITALNMYKEQMNDKNIDSAIEKLSAKLKKNNQKIDSYILIDNSTWGANEQYSEVIETIKKAIEANMCLELLYNSREGETTQRIVEPKYIIFKSGVWYLYAYCHKRKNFRLFRIGRIQKIVPTGEFFKRDESLTPEKIMENLWSTFEDVEIVLEVTKAGIGDVQDWLGSSGTQKIGGYYVVRATVPSDYSFLVSKILGYGNKVRVIEPPALKEELKKEIKKLEKSYKMN